MSKQLLVNDQVTVQTRAIQCFVYTHNIYTFSPAFSSLLLLRDHPRTGCHNAGAWELPTIELWSSKYTIEFLERFTTNLLPKVEIISKFYDSTVRDSRQTGCEACSGILSIVLSKKTNIGSDKHDEFGQRVYMKIWSKLDMLASWDSFERESKKNGFHTFLYTLMTATTRCSS